MPGARLVVRRRNTLSDAGRTEARAATSSGVWTAGSQAATMIVNAVLSILLARVLGATELGLYTYAIALASIGQTVMTGGLNGLAVRVLSSERAANATTLTALILIREGFALVGLAAVTAIGFLAGGDREGVLTLVAASALVGRALEAPEMWFASVLRSGPVARLRFAVVAVVLAARLAALAWVPDLLVLVALYAVEALLSGAAVVVRYLRDPAAPGFARTSPHEVRRLLAASWPLLLSGIGYQLNQRVDVVLIQLLMSPGAVGVYAVATQVSQLAYFLPMVFMNAVVPVLVRAREEPDGGRRYRALLQAAYTRWFWLGAGFAVACAATAGWAVPLLFGAEYADAVPVLVVHVAACPFVFMSAVYSKWIVVEGYLWSSTARHWLGTAVNIAANLVLIPRLGLVGAALATLLSYVTASYLSCWAGPRTRLAAVQMSRAVLAPALALRRRRSTP